MTTTLPFAAPSLGPPVSHARIILSLVEATDADPIARKRLIGPDINYGRELLVTLARLRGGWIGWEAANLRGIAESLAFVALARHGYRIASDVETGAIANRAIDEAIAKQRVHSRTASLVRSLGFRHAVRDALLELRMAGVATPELSAGVANGTPARELAEILPIYETMLAEARLVDPAGVFRAAIDAFDAEAPYVIDGNTYLAPTLTAHGLPAILLGKLIGRGARMLDGDSAVDVPIPPDAALRATGRAGVGTAVPACGQRTLLAWVGAAALPARDDASLMHCATPVDVFAAATPTDELREVLRRSLAEGWRWEDVEIVASDPDTYGIALDVLSQRLEIGTTMLQGIPLARTRLGRALDRWLAWLEDGLPADAIRQAMEAGELASPDDGVAPTALGRELRALQVGWGRARWDGAIARLRRGIETRPYEDESADDHAARHASRQRSVKALEGLLTELLAAVPAVPERGEDRPVASSTSALARATLTWLALVPLHGAPEARTAERLRSRLEQVAALDEPDVPFSAAIGGLRDALGDLRAWPMFTDERKPWSAAGGHVHLTDIAHAGTTGRPRTFVVGLDAARTNGSGRQDPLLPDSVRRGLPSGSLATTVERRESSAWKMATALASLRGRVTLSYATSGSLDGSEAGPSPLLLQAWRLSRGDGMASYEALREALRPPACAVPAEGGTELSAATARSCLDSRDAWLSAMADGPLLLDGSALVRSCHPLLDAGMRAAEAASGSAATGHHGIVPLAAGQLDPTARIERQISPSSLELLARCPMAWFYRNGLGIRAPSDPEYDPEAWLDASGRGALLHEIYEAFARTYLDRQQDIVNPAAREEILVIAEAIIERWRADVPPPSETVFEAERAELRIAAISFLEMERQQLLAGDGSAWWKLEHEFGGSAPIGRFVLPDGRSISVRGRADRVDRLPDGTLAVIDYKTGKASRFQQKPKQARFAGGRQLQPALYSAVLENLLTMPVARFEYRFPTGRGEGEIVSYTAAELAEVPALIQQLLEHLQFGHFIATDDCTDCTYCDYRAICRSTDEGYGKVATPRADWAKANGERLDVYRILRSIRSTGDAS